MSTLTPSRGSSVSQHLHATTATLRDAIFDVKLGVTPDTAEFDVLEQGAFEVLQLIRSWRNAAAPINRIPSEILTVLPDFWDEEYDSDRDADIIALTHVCRAWREAFISRSILWTDFDCVNADKTLVYLERSKSSPINLSLARPYGSVFPNDPLFQVTHRTVIKRLRSVFVCSRPEGLQVAIDNLSHHAPLLECFSISGPYKVRPDGTPMLTPALFGGDISSLRKLHLENVHTGLPWRNMVRLTSLRLVDVLPLSIRQLLDFFESAPHLRKVFLYIEFSTPSDQSGRLVSLACLKNMSIDGSQSSTLLDHLLIPVGARLTAHVRLPSPPTNGHPPKFLDNLRNLPDFTIVRLNSGSCPRMEFSGPNGEVHMTPAYLLDDGPYLALEALTQFDTSKTERLEIDFDFSQSSCPPHQILLPMKDLHALTLSHCVNPHDFIHALNPSTGQSGVMVCPRLEELDIDVYQGTLEIEDVIGMAAARKSGGAGLKSVSISCVWGCQYAQLDILKLKSHVSHVEC